MAASKSQEPDILNLPARIEAELESFDIPSPFKARSAWYLAQMYVVASQYKNAVRRLARAEPGASEAVLNDMIWIRETGKALLFNVLPLTECVEILIDYVEGNGDEPEEKEAQKSGGISLVGASDSLTRIHRRYAKSLFERLVQAGCSKRSAEAFVDDVLDLLSELEALIQMVKRILGGKKGDSSHWLSLLSHIAYTWRIGGHARYHLGGFQDQDNDFSHPGILGWSVIILSEIEQKSGNETGAR